MRPTAIAIVFLLVLVQAPAQSPTDQQAPPAAPVPPGEKAVSGILDVGYRWVGNVDGDFNTYRSVVNLGSGPKLFGADFSLRPAKPTVFDRLDFRLSNWGGDPYNTAWAKANKAGIYELTFDYSNLAYFNFLPSFANPQFSQGILLNQRSYDTTRRTSNFQLDLLPGKWISPYVGYTRNSGFGTGITDFVSFSNEYPVASRYRDHTDNYRAGVNFDFGSAYLTLEGGKTYFKDDQQVYTATRNPGNRTSTFLGQSLYLDNLQQNYGIRGESLYTRANASGNVGSWMSLYGQYLFSQPETTSHYEQVNEGQFYSLELFRFYSGQLDMLDGTAKLPHTLANGSVELRPIPRLRLTESISTDRLHNAAFAALTEQLFFAGGTANPTTTGSDRLVMNFNQHEFNAFFDATPRLTVRGGHRYVWGDSTVRAGSLNQAGPFESGELRRHVGLAGVNYRASQKWNLNLSYEGSAGDRTYFRTSLQDYHKARLQARYQPFTSFSFTANFDALANENPDPNSNYSFSNYLAGLSTMWMPGGGKRFSLLTEYTWSRLRSEIDYVEPFPPQRLISLYRENAHTATALGAVAIPLGGNHELKFSGGGHMFLSSGSRPASYYQPNLRLSAPIVKWAEWYFEYRWYGFSQPFYTVEGFRTHHYVTGFRFTM